MRATRLSLLKASSLGTGVPTHEMFLFWTLTQVHRFSKSFHILFYVYMLSSTVLAIPAPSRPTIINEQGRSVVIFHNKPCIPVESSLLHQQMGPAFDMDRMALDQDSTKRSVLRERSAEGAPVEDYDDVPDEDDGADDDEEELVDELESQESKRVSEYSTNNDGRSSRHRRDTVLEQGEHSSYYNNDDRDTNSRITKRSIRKSLKTILKRLERKQRKRRYSASMASPYFHPPWECEMEVRWEKLKDEYFPPYLQTGKCKSQKCVLNLYECIPKLYPVQILRRDPERCNPVPSLGLNTTYEERWYFERKHVTVCCECGRRAARPSRRRYRKRP